MSHRLRRRRVTQQAPLYLTAILRNVLYELDVLYDLQRVQYICIVARTKEEYTLLIKKEEGEGMEKRTTNNFIRYISETNNLKITKIIIDLCDHRGIETLIISLRKIISSSKYPISYRKFSANT